MMPSPAKDMNPTVCLARFCNTVLLLAFTDLAFSIDSVAAAVAISDQIVLISTGAFIGIVALRFTSALFIRWLDLYPRLETAGFLAVAFVALRLIVHVVVPSLNQPDWLTLVVVLFGLFLLIQSASLRLEFKEDALIVWQNSRELRRFPYNQWLSWRLFAPWCQACFIPRNPEHSLPADPVQPQGAAGTAGTAGRSPGSTERRHGRQHEQ